MPGGEAMAADRIIGGLSVDTYTDAPLRVARAVYLNAPPKSVFAVISDHVNADQWLPLVNRVNVNRGHASERNGTGTIRYLHSLPRYFVRQYIIAYHAPHLLAYSIEEHAFITQHVAIMLLEPERFGGTNLFWRHYFHSSWWPGLTIPLTSLVLHQTCTWALFNLIGHFGGQPR
ncbi:MAG: hypothetical protein CL610_22785 [Anaerolineaceae bacterium]|nr:hypothetical protein [Anaerolineaceae bacterium]